MNTTNFYEFSKTFGIKSFFTLFAGLEITIFKFHDFSRFSMTVQTLFLWIKMTCRILHKPLSSYSMKVKQSEEKEATHHICARPPLPHSLHGSHTAGPGQHTGSWEVWVPWPSCDWLFHKRTSDGRFITSFFCRCAILKKKKKDYQMTSGNPETTRCCRRRCLHTRSLWWPPWSRSAMTGKLGG